MSKRIPSGITRTYSVTGLVTILRRYDRAKVALGRQEQVCHCHLANVLCFRSSFSLARLSRLIHRITHNFANATEYCLSRVDSMAPRRGSNSLKQAAQNSLARSIVLEDISADVLNRAPTQIAVAIMKQVTEEVERVQKAAAAKSSAMLKQKQYVRVLGC
jgi:hypothetical protein